MINYCSGNILLNDAEALVNTVNTVGVMGKGIALQFKKAFPEMEKEYALACRRNEVVVGKMHIWDSGAYIPPRYIINFPTKKHWRHPSQLSYIKLGLVDLVEQIQRLGIQSVAIPPLGCGHGGLSWALVKNEIEKAFQKIPEVEVFLYEPVGVPRESEILNNTPKPLLTPTTANILRMIYQYYILEYFNPHLIEIHKLLYFYEKAGEPLNLHFKKYKYGPYSDSVRHILGRLDGHYISGLGTGESRPLAEVRILPECMKSVNEFLERTSDPSELSQRNADRVLKLIEGFENPYGMELLASVAWATMEDNIVSLEEIIQYLQNWNERKSKIIKPAHVKIAWERLKHEQWI